MAKDLRILLSADLNEQQTVNDINKTLAKIQNQLIKIQVKIDTSALMAALKQFQTAAKSASSNASSTAANATSAQMKAVYQQLQAESKKVRDILSSDVKKLKDVLGTAADVSIRRDAKGAIQSATVSYTDQLGKQVKQTYGWVFEEVNGKMQKSFQYLSENVKSNSGKVQGEMDRLLAKIEKLKHNLTSGSTKIFDVQQAQGLVAEYDRIYQAIEKAKNAGTMWSKTTAEGIEAQILANQRLTAEYQRQQKALIRESNLGKTQIGSLNGLNLESAQVDQIKKLYQDQLTAHLKKEGKSSNVQMENISIDSWTKDSGTGQWVARLSATVEDGKNKIMKYKATMDAASDSVRLFGERVLTTANRNLSFLEKLKIAMQSIPIWMVGMTAFYQTLHFFSDGMKFVNDLNQSLTQLSIVFNTSQEGVAHFGKEFHDLAMNMSMTTEEVAKGAVEFARQGLSQSEMIDKMKTASIYAKISNLDFNESAKILTATVNSMGVTAEHAADIFSYMGDATATGADEIGKAMQRVGGTAGAVGLSFEKLSSWIAVVSSRTREGAETIGNAFKSIIARYQSIKEQGFDETDGTKINQVTKALADVGIKAVDARGQLLNFGDIMDQLGEKWVSLDGKQKAYLATTVAGTYQQSRFLNIMEGYSDSVKLYTNSLDKAGIAQQKFDRYQEGTQAHLDRLKTAWHGVFQSSFDSTGIQAGIDMLTKLALLFDQLIQKVGLVPVAFAALTGVLLITTDAFKNLYVSMFKATSMSSLMKGFTSLGMALEGTAAKTTSLIAQLRLLQITGGTSTAAMGLLQIATNGLGVAFKALGTAIGVTIRAIAPLAAFMAIGYIIQKVTDRIQENVQKQKEFDDMMKTVATNMTNNRDSINKLIAEYEKLKDATNSGTFGDQKDIERYWEVSKSLSDMLPNLVDHIDEQGRAHLRNKDAINEELKVAEQLAKAQASKTLGGASREFQSKTGDYKQKLDAKKEAEAYYQAGQDYIEKLEKDGKEVTLGLINEIHDRQAGMTKKHYELKASFDDIKKDFVEVTKAMQMDTGVKFSDELMQQLDKYIDTLNFADKQTMENYELVLTKVAGLQKGLNAAGNDASKQKEAMTQFGLAVQSMKVGDLDAFMKNLQKALDDAANKAKTATGAILDYKVALKQMQDSYKDSADKLEILNGLLDDNAKGKRISAEEVAKLIKEDANMVDMFTIENGQIKLNTEAIKNKKDEMIKAFETETTGQRNALIEQNKALLQKLGMYELEVQGIGEVGEQLDIVNKKYGEMYEKANAAYNATGQQGPAYDEKLFRENREAEALIKNLDSLKKQATIYSTALNTVGQDKVAPKDKKDDIVKPYDETNVKKYKIDIDEINAKINGQEKATSALDKTSQVYRDGLKEEIKLQKEKQKAAEENANSLREQQDSLEKQIAAYGDWNSLSNDSKDKLNDLKKQLDDTKKSIVDMSNSWWDAYGKVNQLTYDEVESALNEFELRIKGVDNALEESQAQQGIYKEDSRQWTAEVNKQIAAMKEKQALLHQEAELIRDRINEEDLNAEQVRELTEKLRQLGITWLNIQQTINKNEEDLMRKRTDAANQVIDVYKDMLGKQKDLMDNAYQDQINAVEKEHQVQMDKIDEQDKAFQRLIDTKKKAYEQASDERKYNQDLAKRQQEQRELQAQIDALSMDKSAAAQSKLRDLKKKILEVNTDIDNMQKDHRDQQVLDALDTAKDIYDEQKEKNKNTLDQQYKDKKDALEKEKKLNDQYIDDLVKDDQRWAAIRKQVEQGHVTDVINGLGQITNSWENFVNSKAPLLAENLKKNLFNEVDQALKDQKTRIDDLSTSLSNLASTSDIIDNMRQRSIQAQAPGANVDVLHNQNMQDMDKLIQSGMNVSYDPNVGYVDGNGNPIYTTDGYYKPATETEANWINQMKNNSSSWFTANLDDKKRYEEKNKQLANWLGATKDANGDWVKNGLRLYHKGGIVGGSSDRMTNLINQMFNAAPNEQVIMALEEELMSPSKNIVKNFMPNLGGLVGNIAANAASVATTGSVININIASVTGDKKGADLVSTTIVKELKKLGRQF